mgnify:CR=1 FL=1
MGRRVFWCMILFGLLAPSVAVAQSYRHQTFADVTVTGAVTTIRAENQAREALTCTNTHATVHIRWGDGNISTTRGSQLRATLTLSLTGLDAKPALSMVSEGADVTMSCTEGTR